MPWRAAIGLLKPPSVCPSKPKLHELVVESTSSASAVAGVSKMPRKTSTDGIAYGGGLGCGSGEGHGSFGSGSGSFGSGEGVGRGPS